MMRGRYEIFMGTAGLSIDGLRVEGAGHGYN
jgi:hypothetical protein